MLLLWVIPKCVCASANERCVHNTHTCVPQESQRVLPPRTPSSAAIARMRLCREAEDATWGRCQDPSHQSLGVPWKRSVDVNCEWELASE